MKPIIDSVAEKNDGSMMIVAYNGERPNIVFAFDDVRVILDNDMVGVDYNLSISAATSDVSELTDEDLAAEAEQLMTSIFSTIIEKSIEESKELHEQ